MTMDLLTLIVLLPLAGFLLNGLLGNRLGKGFVSVVGCGLPIIPGQNRPSREEGSFVSSIENSWPNVAQLLVRGRSLYGAQICAVDDHRQSVTALQIDRRAHCFEGLLDALHGATREALVTDEPSRKRMSCDDASQQARRRAAVAAVEISVRGV